MQANICFCRYGNSVTASAAGSLLVKVNDGGGDQEGSVFDLPQETVVQFTCQKAGVFLLEDLWLP